MKHQPPNDLLIVFDGIKVVGLAFLLVTIIFIWGLSDLFHLKFLELWINKITGVSAPAKN